MKTNSFKLTNREPTEETGSLKASGAHDNMAIKPAQKETLKVILDANALFVPLQFKIDIFSDLKRLLNRSFEAILLSPVKRELEALAKKGAPKLRKNAAYALELAAKCKYVEIDASIAASTDDIILKIAKEWGAPVLTNDRPLRKRLRDISVPVIYVRQKSRLEIDGLI